MTALPHPPNQPLTIPNPLPTSRALLTSLLTAISTIPLTPTPQPDQTDQPPRQPNSENPQPKRRISSIPSKQLSPEKSNPLRRVPPSHRHLIVTLHVLFPGLVLPALDLLERGLVARVALLDVNGNTKVIDGDAGGGGGDAAGMKRSGVGLGAVVGGGGDAALDATDEEGGTNVQPAAGAGNQTDADVAAAAARDGKRKRKKTHAFYLVQSAATAEAANEARRRRRKQQHGDDTGGDGWDGTGTGTAVSRGKKGGYIVRLDAWNCSCVVFAFAAVQGEAVTGASHGWEGEGGGMGDGDGVGEAGTEWSFGGMSLDGLAVGAGEGVPVCKHLLACLLAERWSAALGSYVVDRRVGREEMAGIVADV